MSEQRKEYRVKYSVEFGNFRPDPADSVRIRGNVEVRKEEDFGFADDLLLVSVARDKVSGRVLSTVCFCTWHDKELSLDETRGIIEHFICELQRRSES